MMEASTCMVSFLVTLTVYCVSSCGAATGDCVQVNTCKCQYQDDNSVIDLESVAKKDEFAFPYHLAHSPFRLYQYAYNPCYPVTDTDDCKDVAACQKDSHFHFSIADASSANFTKDADDDLVLHYTSIDRDGNSKELLVKLVCNESVTNASLDVVSEFPWNTYNFVLTSECCCPNGCVQLSEGQLSAGSIIIIGFLVLVVVYLVSGIVYKALVKKSRGPEVIPNYAFWRSLPGLTKDGFMFSYNKIRQSMGSNTGYSIVTT